MSYSNIPQKKLCQLLQEVFIHVEETKISKSDFNNELEEFKDTMEEFYIGKSSTT